MKNMSDIENVLELFLKKLPKYLHQQHFQKPKVINHLFTHTHTHSCASIKCVLTFIPASH